MNLSELLSALASYPRDAEVKVVGHGRLHSITHAYAEDGGAVLLLYVEEGELGAESAPGSDVPGGAGPVPGDAASVAPQEEGATTSTLTR